MNIDPYQNDRLTRLQLKITLHPASNLSMAKTAFAVLADYASYVTITEYNPGTIMLQLPFWAFGSFVDYINSLANEVVVQTCEYAFLPNSYT
jgi:hypothetical protein